MSEGFTTTAFEGVRDVLDKSLESGADLGASVAVHYRGEVVVDIWGGYTDETRTTPWASDTLVNVWSTTKTMTFLVTLLLADRGDIDLNRPVADYWPEFAAGGKSAITVRNILGHTAGLSGWTERLVPEDLADWDKCTSALARQEPWWTPGTQSGYHAVTQGFLIGEIVRRITGQSIGSFFKKELAEPLGADFHIGLAEADEPRVSVVVAPPPADFSGQDPNSIMVRTMTSPPLDGTMPSNRWWRAAEIPAANGHGNARSVALVQSIVANGGEANGQRFLKPETLEEIFVTTANGQDLVLGVPMHFGAGYGLSSETFPLGPRACAWGGFGGSVIIMDLDSQMTISYMMNQMRVGLIGDTRGSEIAFAAAMAAASA